MAEASNSVEKDEELEELLDSALEDFNKAPPAPSEPPPESGKTTASATDTKDDDIPPWNQEFLLEAQKEFEKNMKSLFGAGADGEFSPEQFEDQLKKIADEANKVISEQANQDPEFSATIAQTLKNLSESSEKVQSELGPDALTAMLGGMGLGPSADDGGDPSGGEFMPFMQSMMQSFLSKEVLYPSFKEITDKYPGWLEEHKATLPEAELANYTQQLELMKKVCQEFESETETDSEETKKQRFAKIFSVMEEMQKLGQPPKELCLDENGAIGGLPNLDASECSIM